MNEFENQGINREIDGYENEYTGGVQIGENGEYSYVCIPKKQIENEKKVKAAKNKVRVFTVIAVLATALSLCLAGVSLAFAMSLKDSLANDDQDGLYLENVQGTVSIDFNEGESESASKDDLLNSEISIEKAPQNTDSGLTSAGEAYGSVTDVFREVSDSVVEISTKVQMGYHVNTGEGSGVIISDEGYIITNHHVIEDASAITVRLTDSSQYEATLVGTSERDDIAIIKIDAGEKQLCVAKIGNSKDLVVGEQVVAIGNPLGALAGTTTTGIISATERNINISGSYMNLLQTDAAINPGNSGGGLFNMAGELIGVVNAKIADEDVEGIGFAIPSDHAYEVMLDLIKYGYVKGISDNGLTLLDATSKAVAYRYNLKYTGIYVIESKYNEDIKNGDRIISVDGIEITSIEDIDAITSKKSVGDELEIVVARDKEQFTYTLILGEYVPDDIIFE